MNDWKNKLLLNWYCAILWSGKFCFYQEKSGKLKSDVCSNHKGVENLWGEREGDVHRLGDTQSSIFFVDPCQLACLSSRLVLTWHGLVADGNRCTNHPDIFDVCIAGQCRVRKNKVVPKEIWLAVNTLVSFAVAFWAKETINTRAFCRIKFLVPCFVDFEF